MYSQYSLSPKKQSLLHRPLTSYLSKLSLRCRPYLHSRPFQCHPCRKIQNVNTVQRVQLILSNLKRKSSPKMKMDRLNKKANESVRLRNQMKGSGGREGLLSQSEKVREYLQLSSFQKRNNLDKLIGEIEILLGMSSVRQSLYSYDIRQTNRFSSLQHSYSSRRNRSADTPLYSFPKSQLPQIHPLPKTTLPLDTLTYNFRHQKQDCQPLIRTQEYYKSQPQHLSPYNQFSSLRQEVSPVQPRREEEFPQRRMHQNSSDQQIIYKEIQSKPKKKNSQKQAQQIERLAPLTQSLALPYPSTLQNTQTFLPNSNLNGQLVTLPQLHDFYSQKAQPRVPAEQTRSKGQMNKQLRFSDKLEKYSQQIPNELPTILSDIQRLNSKIQKLQQQDQAKSKEHQIVKSLQIQKPLSPQITSTRLLISPLQSQMALSSTFKSTNLTSNQEVQLNHSQIQVQTSPIKPMLFQQKNAARSPDHLIESTLKLIAPSRLNADSVTASLQQVSPLKIQSPSSQINIIRPKHWSSSFKNNSVIPTIQTKAVVQNLQVLGINSNNNPKFTGFQKKKLDDEISGYNKEGSMVSGISSNNSSSKRNQSQALKRFRENKTKRLSVMIPGSHNVQEQGNIERKFRAFLQQGFAKGKLSAKDVVFNTASCFVKQQLERQSYLSLNQTEFKQKIRLILQPYSDWNNLCQKFLESGGQLDRNKVVKLVQLAFPGRFKLQFREDCQNQIGKLALIRRQYKPLTQVGQLQMQSLGLQPSLVQKLKSKNIRLSFIDNTFLPVKQTLGSNFRSEWTFVNSQNILPSQKQQYSLPPFKYKSNFNCLIQWLCQNPQLLASIFALNNPQTARLGVYFLKFGDNIIQLDGFLPEEDGKSLNSGVLIADGKEYIWPLLLQKGISKFLGSYDSLINTTLSSIQLLDLIIGKRLTKNRIDMRNWDSANLSQFNFLLGPEALPCRFDYREGMFNLQLEKKRLNLKQVVSSYNSYCCFQNQIGQKNNYCIQLQNSSKLFQIDAVEGNTIHFNFKSASADSTKLFFFTLSHQLQASFAFSQFLFCSHAFSRGGTLLIAGKSGTRVQMQVWSCRLRGSVLDREKRMRSFEGIMNSYPTKWTRITSKLSVRRLIQQKLNLFIQQIRNQTDKQMNIHQTFVDLLDDQLILQLQPHQTNPTLTQSRAVYTSVLSGPATQLHRFGKRLDAVRKLASRMQKQPLQQCFTLTVSANNCKRKSKTQRSKPLTSLSILVTLKSISLQTHVYTNLNRLENLVNQKHEKVVRALKNTTQITTRSQQSMLEIEGKFTKMQMRANVVQKQMDSKVGPEQLMKVSQLISRQYTPLQKYQKQVQELNKLKSKVDDKVDRLHYSKETQGLKSSLNHLRNQMCDIIRNQMQTILDQYLTKVQSNQTTRIIKSLLRQEFRKDKVQLTTMVHSQFRVLEQSTKYLTQQLALQLTSNQKHYKEIKIQLDKKLASSQFNQAHQKIINASTQLQKKLAIDISLIKQQSKFMAQRFGREIEQIKCKVMDQVKQVLHSIDNLSRKVRIELKQRENQVKSLQQRVQTIYEQNQRDINYLKSAVLQEKDLFSDKFKSIDQDLSRLKSVTYKQQLFRFVKQQQSLQDRIKEESQRQEQQSIRIKREEEIKLGLRSPLDQFKGLPLQGDLYQKLAKLIGNLSNVQYQISAIRSILSSKVSMNQLQKRLDEKCSNESLHTLQLYVQEIHKTIKSNLNPKELDSKIREISTSYGAQLFAAKSLLEPKRARAVTAKNIKNQEHSESWDLRQSYKRLRSIKQMSKIDNTIQTLELPPFFIDSDFEQGGCKGKRSINYSQDLKRKEGRLGQTKLSSRKRNRER